MRMVVLNIAVSHKRHTHLPTKIVTLVRLVKSIEDRNAVVDEIRKHYQSEYPEHRVNESISAVMTDITEQAKTLVADAKLPW